MVDIKDLAEGRKYRVTIHDVCTTAYFTAHLDWIDHTTGHLSFNNGIMFTDIKGCTFIRDTEDDE